MNKSEVSALPAGWKTKLTQTKTLRSSLPEGVKQILKFSLTRENYQNSIDLNILGNGSILLVYPFYNQDLSKYDISYFLDNS